MERDKSSGREGEAFELLVSSPTIANSVQLCLSSDRVTPVRQAVWASGLEAGEAPPAQKRRRTAKLGVERRANQDDGVSVRFEWAGEGP